MENRTWVKWDRFMKVSHQYTGLFLVPWMLVYAVSAFCLNHHEWFEERLQLGPDWKNINDEAFTPGPEFPDTPDEQAVAILKHLDLDGPHRILGKPDANQMIMFRYCATGHYKVSWFPSGSRITVEKQQPTSFYSVVNALHFRYGYENYAAAIGWAIIVDVVTTSTVIWIVSGIWLWARRTRARLLGGVCLITGSLSFAGLAILLCR